MIWFLVQVAIINGYHLYIAVWNQMPTTESKLHHFLFELLTK